MNFFYGLTRAAFFLFIAFFVSSCSKSDKPPVWDYDVVGRSYSADQNVSIDIYLDATKSMEGFASPETNFAKLLKDIDVLSRNSFGNSIVNLYKFGDKIEGIGRENFLDAYKIRTKFYREKGLSHETRIDNVIDSVDVSKLTVVITDLFQKGQDLNDVISKIKLKCFDQGLDFGLISIKSQFNGMVYDVYDSPYHLSQSNKGEIKYRPVYALVFGKNYNIKKLFRLLENKSYAEEHHFLLISPLVTESFVVELKPDMKNDFQKAAVDNTRPLSDMLYRLKNKKNKDIIVVPVNIKYKQYKYIPRFSSNLELVVYKQTRKKKSNSFNTFLSTEVKLDKLNISNDSLIQSKLVFSVPSEKGWHSYKMYLNVPEVEGFVLPEWVDSLSSENPGQYDEEYKTMNLKNFIGGILQANTSARKPGVAKIYFTY